MHSLVHVKILSCNVSHHFIDLFYYVIETQISFKTYQYVVLISHDAMIIKQVLFLLIISKLEEDIIFWQMAMPDKLTA